MDRRLTLYILIGMLLGVIVGAILFYSAKFGLIPADLIKMEGNEIHVDFDTELNA